MGIFNKKELLKIEELENEIKQLNLKYESLGIENELNAINELQGRITKLQEIEVELTKKIYSSEKELDELKNESNTLLSLVKELNDEIEVTDYGLYKPKFDCMNTEEYSQRILKNREYQKEMIKTKTALTYYDGWILEGSKTKGRAMNNDNMKMVLKAFNFECDTIISKVKYNNVDTIAKRIAKSSQAINKLNERNRIEITTDYINFKLEELYLVHEFNVKKQEEKETLRAQREAEREEAKLQKEIEEARKKIQKDKIHYEKARKDLEEKLVISDEKEREAIQKQLAEINNSLGGLEEKLHEVDYREANQKAGYVYVISNIGSFGKNVYKIGMTRRLEPQDRIDELGDASVPFVFDMHALIFSEDAPKLENILHKALNDKRLNLVNNRKEFFNTTLEEIESIIKANYDGIIDINKHADAIQYNETIKLRQGE